MSTFETASMNGMYSHEIIILQPTHTIYVLKVAKTELPIQ